VKIQICGVGFVDEACFSVRDAQGKVFDIPVNKGTVSEDSSWKNIHLVRMFL
jgi:hypothetical protein